MHSGKMVTFKTHDDYDAHEAIRSTKLKEIMSPQGPRGYLLKYERPVVNVDKAHDKWHCVQPKVNELVLGSLFHEFTLQGIKRFFRVPERYRRGSAAWADVIEEQQGGPFHIWGLTPLDYDKLHAWRDAVLRNADAKRMIESRSFQEQSFTAKHELGFEVKARLDLFQHDGAIVDLKSTYKNNRDDYERQMRDLNYPFSAAFYEECRNAVPEFHGMRAPFTHLVLCKEHPYYCYLWPVDRNYIRDAKREVEAAFVRLRACKDRQAKLAEEGKDILDAWPDFQERQQNQTIAPPEWWLEKKGWRAEDHYVE